MGHRAKGSEGHAGPDGVAADLGMHPEAVELRVEAPHHGGRLVRLDRGLVGEQFERHDHVGVRVDSRQRVGECAGLVDRSRGELSEPREQVVARAGLGRRAGCCT